MAIIIVQGYSLKQNNWKKMGKVYSRDHNLKQNDTQHLYSNLGTLDKRNWNKGR